MGKFAWELPKSFKKERVGCASMAKLGKKGKRVLKVLITIVCLLLVFALVCTGLSFGNAKKAKPAVPENALTEAVVSVSGGEQKGDGFTGEAGAVYTAEFAAPTTLDTVILEEDGANVYGFTIEAEVNGTFQTVHAQDDRIGEYRYCAFPAVEATALRVTVQDADAPFTIRNIAAGAAERRATDDFRVTAYVTAPTAYDREGLFARAGSFDVITDVILINSVYFTADGTLTYAGVDDGNGGTVDGLAVLETALTNLRDAIGERDVRIHCTLLGPDAPEGTPEADQANAKCDQHNLAFSDNRDTLIQNILQLAEDYDFDGIYFDYEYPRRFKDWFAYSRFLSALKAAFDGEYQLGAAMPVWKNLWEMLLIRPLDISEVMGYDNFDADGYHANFAATASGITEKYLSLGFSASKLDLGMPFYARPTDAGAYWYSYSGDAGQLGKYQNVAEGVLAGSPETEGENVPDRYYNGWQMVYDKTAYAIDAGLAGVMVWHYACDLPYENELSLFHAMGQAIADRSAQA